MNSDNSKIIEAATTAAFMMKGLHAAGYDQCIKSWDRGCIEMVQEMTSYVPMIISVIDVASSNDVVFDGVFDYEVSVPFGKWFGEQIIERGDTPPKKEAAEWLSKGIAAFFAHRDELESGAYKKAMYLIVRQFIESELHQSPRMN